jgi:adenylate kinase
LSSLFSHMSVLLEAFKRHDNGNPELSREAFLELLDLSGVDKKDAQLALQAICPEADGKVNYVAFLTWMASGKKPRKNIILMFGPPASGKGTHGGKTTAALKIPQLSTGDMLREAVDAGSEIGLRAKEIMASGKLVSDDIVIGIIKERIKATDCVNGFILDGFPRTVAQAKALDEMLAVTGEEVRTVLELSVPDEALIERIGGRWIHKSSGRSYHTKYNPPKSYDGKSEPTSENMRDDETGEPLIQRPDDNKDTLPKRLQAYHAETVPVLGHYKARSGCRVSQVDANLSDARPTEAIWADCAKALGISA